MEMTPVASSLLKSVAFNPEKEELCVELHKGGSYVYRGVPRPVFDAMMDENSVGGYFLRNIKGRYECVKEQSGDFDPQPR
jgi:hypothetical protein